MMSFMRERSRVKVKSRTAFQQPRPQDSKTDEPSTLTPQPSTLNPQPSLGRPGLGRLGGKPAQAIGASFWLHESGRGPDPRWSANCPGTEEKCPGLGGPGGIPAQAFVGIRLVVVSRRDRDDRSFNACQIRSANRIRSWFDSGSRAGSNRSEPDKKQSTCQTEFSTSALVVLPNASVCSTYSYDLHGCRKTRPGEGCRPAASA